MRKIAAALALLTAAAGCERAPAADTPATREPTAAAEPVGDRTTPEATVRSWWRYTDSIQHHDGTADTTSDAHQRLQQRVRDHESFHGGAALEYLRHPPEQPTFAREIVDVQQRGPTHAVVTVRIRNTTPIPPGAVPGEYDAARRRHGELHRYHLGLHPDGWRIEQAQSWDEFATGWRDVYGRDAIVPTWTHP